MAEVCLFFVFSLIKQSKCLGAAEMLMANAVSQLAERTPGKESVAIESFARALRQVIHFFEILLIFSINIILYFSCQQSLPIMPVMIVPN